MSSELALCKIGGPHYFQGGAFCVCGAMAPPVIVSRDEYNRLHDDLAAAWAEVEQVRALLVAVLDRHPEEKDDLPVETALILTSPGDQGRV